MHHRSRLRPALLICTALIVTACASRHLVAQADWEQGAREGKIVRDYALPGSPALPDCLAQLAPDQRADRHFVQVRYTQARHIHFGVAQLPANLDATIGDLVEIWPQDCAAGQYGRIAKVFSNEHH